MLNSGTLAQRAGVNKQTIRYYERIGLIEAAPRNESGYRLYTEAAVDRLRFIQSAKDLGFQLAEIQELLSLRIDRRSNCDRVREKAFAKREDIRRKIRSLKRLDRVLGGLIGACDERAATDACPILAALDTKSKSRMGT